jgi:type I restriction enzyme S subunit
MNAHRLLALFDRVSEAPDAVAKLRRFVLDLAMSGKLVERGSLNWKSAKIEECLEPLADGRVMHQGWSPQCETVASSSNDAWGVLKTTAIQDGYFLPEHNKRLPEKLEAKPKLEVRAGDILITCAGPRARCGVACLVRDTRPKLMISGKMYRFRVDVERFDPSFVELYLRSTRARTAIDAMKSGSSESGLNLTHDRFRDLLMHFGALEEQKRIVARVDELMALCDQLEAARADRGHRRARLTKATLNRINTPDAAFQADAHFALEVLPDLTSLTSQIPELRNSILNLAVHGKLVPQSSAEEPAGKFLARLAGAFPAASKRSPPGMKSLSPAKLPFACPPGWEWTTVQRILDPSREVSYGVIKLGDEPKSGGIPILRCSDVKSGFIDLANVRKVSEEIESEYLRTRLFGGEVLVNIRGTLGGVAKVPDEIMGYNVAREVAVVPVAKEISAEFIVYVMRSQYFWDSIQENLRGIAYKGLNLGTLREFPIPFPPLAEQRRIVARVDELMALCDQLEASLAAADTANARLLDAILQEALNGRPAAEAA